MAKTLAIIALIGTTLCLCLSSALCDDLASSGKYIIKGTVFCDPCRVQFKTKLSTGIEDVKLVLQCRNETTEVVTYTKEGKTGKNGNYMLEAEGDHEEEICEVRAMDSPMKDCSIPFDAYDKAKVVLTQNVGIPGYDRYASILGFMTQGPDPKCQEVLKELFPDGVDDQST